jgi:hypothetical protein
VREQVGEQDPTGGVVEAFDESAFEDTPFEVPEPPVTGDPIVDEAAQRVGAAVQEPLDTQVAVYDAVHRALQDRLADVED